MTILPFPSDDSEPDEQQPGGELAVPHEARPGWLRGWLERQPPLPSLTRVKQRTHWWVFEGSVKIGHFLLRSPWLALKEAVPILRGLGRLLGGYARWVAVANWADTVSAAEGTARANHARDVEKMRSNRRRLTLVVVVVMAGGTWWAVAEHPGYVVLTGVGVACVCDVAGRRGSKQVQKAPVMPRSPLTEGTSLSSLRTELQQQLETEGFDHEELVIDMPMPVRNGWRVAYHSRQAIEDTHLRALERALQIRRNGITQLREPGNAARGELWITLKDPLAELIPSPDLPEQSIYNLLPLGKNANGGNWEELFLRTHFSVTGASQSGKSSLFWQIIYVLRRCPEVELDAIDLTDGPCFSACRRAFRRRATDETGAAQILEEAIALIKKRAGELSRLAEDDDTPDEYEEKHAPTREHPQRIVLIDEGARVTENEHLLPLVEYVLRYGAKTAVTLGLAGQGGTLDDFGSSIVRSMMMMKIMLACSSQDVLSVYGKDARDEGYRPDLLEVTQGSNVRDAGKAFVKSAVSQTVEMRRAYRLEQSDVRRRDRELGARVRPEADDGVIDATEVPPILAAAERAFHDAGTPEWMATSKLLAAIRSEFPRLNETTLAAAIKKPGTRSRPGGRQLRGYLYASIQSAMEEL
jgi:hypothetical protein